MFINIISFNLLAQPEIRCLQVGTNGDVTLNWSLSMPQPTCFNSYKIFAANSINGPYTNIGSVSNYMLDNYFHSGASAHMQQKFYFIEVDGCALYTDTVRSVFLTVSNPGNSEAILNWNNIRNPLLPTSSSFYKIYREFPLTNWKLIDSTLNLQYVDTINACNSLINYRVEIQDSYGCISVSNISGALFQDVDPPNIPVIDSVSIDSINGHIYLSWDKNSSGDTEAYIIYKFDGTTFLSYDTIWGINNIFYLDSISTSCNSPEMYKVAAFDTCGNKSPTGLEHNSIVITSAEDVCNGLIILDWNPYINMNPALAGYNIYVKENNGPITLLGTNASSNTSFVHSGLTNNILYCYYVKAFNTLYN